MNFIPGKILTPAPESFPNFFEKCRDDIFRLVASKSSLENQNEKIMGTLVVAKIYGQAQAIEIPIRLT